MVSRLLFITVLSLSMVSAGCGRPGFDQVSGLSQNQYEVPRHYFSTATRIGIEVVYEQGAEPYVGITQTTTNKMPYWQILEDNLRALYQGRVIQPLFSVPKDLSQMRQISKRNKTDWTDQEIFDLSEQVRLNRSSATQAHFLVIFLNGYYNNGNATQPKILGVSIGGTSVIAMFKQVIEASSTAIASPTDKYVEQSTLVHEMGHALGLTNKGLHMIHEHEDHQHTTHCSNPKCVMYWENSGSQALTSYIDQLIKSGSVVMFDNDCLNDARLFRAE